MMVYGTGKGRIIILVTMCATTLLGRLSAIQVSYSTDSSSILFPFHDGPVSFLNFV